MRKLTRKKLKINVYKVHFLWYNIIKKTKITWDQKMAIKELQNKYDESNNGLKTLEEINNDRKIY